MIATTHNSRIDNNKLIAAIQSEHLVPLEVKALMLLIDNEEVLTEEIIITRFATLLECSLCEAIKTQFALMDKGYFEPGFKAPYLPNPTFKTFKLMNDNEVAAIRMYWE